MELYLNYLKLHFKSILEYKLSFVLSLISQIFVFFSYYFVVISMFTKFSNIKGFSLYEVLLTLGIIYFGFSINETFARGIDQFDELIVRGDFDRILLRPKNILLQVIGFKIDYTKLARTVQSIIVIILSLYKLNINWNILKVFTFIFMLISSIVIFFNLFLLAASYCFITIQGLEVRNVFTDGGKNIAQYPMGIFPKSVLKFFTYVIPYSLVNYYPLLYLVGKVDIKLYSILPLLVILYTIPCLLIFDKGSKKYLSTGS